MVKSRTLAVGAVLGILLARGWTPAPARAAVSPPLAAVTNLQKVWPGKKTAMVDAGDGVTLKLAPGPGTMQQTLTLLADGRKLQEVEGGRFIALARLKVGPATYWAISQYTGGAHCCGQFAFLTRPAAGQPVRYLGQTRGYNGGPRDFPGSFKDRQGQLYFESFDDRFDYFHTSHAGSLLVNVPRFYYHLTPTALTVDNIPFKRVYLKEVAAVDEEIRQEASGRRRKPRAILTSPGLGPGFENMVFADNLGQLLVKRTILYLYAREDQKAWDSFKRGVSHYYLTSAWAPQLHQEILKIMGSYPY